MMSTRRLHRAHVWELTARPEAVAGEFAAAPGRSDDLSRFDSGHVGPCVGELLPICCPVSTRGWRRGHEAEGSAGPDDRGPARRSGRL